MRELGKKKIGTDRSGKTYDVSGVTNLRGLTADQYVQLMEYQGFKCPISDKTFEYSHEKKKFLDADSTKAPPIDHDHTSGFIRGILTEKVNQLLDQWELYAYGKLSKPVELTEYKENPPANKIIGCVRYTDK